MTHRYGLSRGELEQLSVDLEDETGYDSIPTIEGMYGGDCVFPGCEVRRLDAAEMWKHVHFSKKHGLSFGAPLPKLIEQRRATIGQSA